MIVIVNRDDIREAHRQWPVENLQLEHVDLAPELAEQAELIVFVEGSEFKFLKHFSAMKSQNSFDVLLSYIKGKPPTKPKPFSVKDFPNHYRHRKKAE